MEKRKTRAERKRVRVVAVREREKKSIEWSEGMERREFAKGGKQKWSLRGGSTKRGCERNGKGGGLRETHKKRRNSKI